MQDESLLRETQFPGLCPSVSPSSLLVVPAETLPPLRSKDWGEVWLEHIPDWQQVLEVEGDFIYRWP